MKTDNTARQFSPARPRTAHSQFQQAEIVYLSILCVDVDVFEHSQYAIWN